MINRPRNDNGALITAPTAISRQQVFGVARTAFVDLSLDEHRALRSLYEAKPDENALAKSMTDVHVVRAAEADGLRMVAWLAQFLEPGADPLRELIKLAAQADWGEVDLADVEWAYDDAQSDAADIDCPSATSAEPRG